MPNLMLTMHCNLSCSYCFAQTLMTGELKSQRMPFALFERLMDWVDATGIAGHPIHLMGGEPTLHPQFEKMIDEIEKRNHPVRVFSNFATDINPDLLTSSARRKIMWIINANPMETIPPAGREMFMANLERVGAAGALCYNFSSSDYDFGYILTYLDQFPLARELKIGVACPTVSHDNCHVQDADYAAVAEGVVALVTAAHARGVAVEFECGVPLCLFNDTQRKALAGIHISHCGSRLDITPDGRVVNCLPLSEILAVPFERFPTYGDALSWYRESLAKYHRLGAKNACLTCSPELRPHCFACLAGTIASMNRISFAPLPGETERLIVCRS